MDDERFEYDLRYADSVAFVRVLYRRVMGVRLLHWAVVVLMLAVATFDLALVAVAGTGGGWWGGAGLAALAVAWGFGAPYLVAAVHRLRLRGRRVFLVGADGVGSGPADGPRWMRWSAFSGVAETDRVFVLLAGGQSVFVPKRAVRGDAELEALRSLFRSRVRTSPLATRPFPGSSEAA